MGVEKNRELTGYYRDRHYWRVLVKDKEGYPSTVRTLVRLQFVFRNGQLTEVTFRVELERKRCADNLQVRILLDLRRRFSLSEMFANSMEFAIQAKVTSFLSNLPTVGQNFRGTLRRSKNARACGWRRGWRRSGN